MRPANVLPKHDGITRNGLNLAEEREMIYHRDRGRCRSCGEPVAYNAFTVAHRIQNTKHFRRRYGDMVIDHPRNKATTHPGRCNDRQNLGHKTAQADALAAEIRAYLSAIDEPRDPYGLEYPTGDDLSAMAQDRIKP